MFEKFFFKQLLESEALGHAKSHGRQGDQGKEGVEGQRRGMRGALASVEVEDRCNDGSADANQKPGDGRVFTSGMPEGLSEKIDQTIQGRAAFFHDEIRCG